MLVLSRKHNESVVVGGISRPEPVLKVTVLEINSSTVILGFEAEKGIPVHRSEVWERIQAERTNGFGPAKGQEQRPLVVHRAPARRRTGTDL
jgi:carbon storage regulator CsrA